ncbi:MAG: type II toxin-antitoxin system VapC family toxin [Cyanobacteria bacterium J06638_28]
MRALIDTHAFITHAFIWWTGEPARLSTLARNFLIDSENEPVLSLASIWEMQIKLALGKLSLQLPLSDLVENEVKQNRLSLLSIELSHIYTLSNLPSHHRDPFDRLLIAQSRMMRLPIVSVDQKLDVYEVGRLW